MKDYVFLAHPVSDFQASDFSYRPEKKLFLSKIIEVIRSHGYDVKCAAINEDFGRIRLEPENFTRYDVDAITTSKIFILVTTERVTRDMYLETGIAYAQGKPIYFFIPFSAYRRHITYMIEAFESDGSINITSYDSEDSLAEMIRLTIPRATEV